MNNKKNFAVLWDMDGVLVDTGEFHFSAWKQIFADLGLEFTNDMFRATFGMNNKGILTHLVNKSMSEDQVSKISDCKESLFRGGIKGQLELLPGVETWLDLFKQAGVMQAVASSAPQKNIDTIIAELALGEYFSAVLSGARMAGKPDPAVFLAAAKRLKTPPERCLVFEDATTGVEAARRGGMKCIAVTTTNPASVLEADVIIDSFEDLSEDTIWNLMA